MKNPKVKNILKIKLFVVIGLFSVPQKVISQQSRDNLRQNGDRYENTGIPNNCDNKLYGITVTGNLFEIENRYKMLNCKEILDGA